MDIKNPSGIIMWTIMFVDAMWALGGWLRPSIPAPDTPDDDSASRIFDDAIFIETDFIENVTRKKKSFMNRAARIT